MATRVWCYGQKAFYEAERREVFFRSPAIAAARPPQLRGSVLPALVRLRVESSRLRIKSPWLDPVARRSSTSSLCSACFRAIAKGGARTSAAPSGRWQRKFVRRALGARQSPIQRGQWCADQFRDRDVPRIVRRHDTTKLPDPIAKRSKAKQFDIENRLLAMCGRCFHR
jgi:hypothetical protein